MTEIQDYVLCSAIKCNLQVSVPEVDLKELKREESKRAAANFRRKLDLENTRYDQEEHHKVTSGFRSKLYIENTR